MVIPHALRGQVVEIQPPGPPPAHETTAALYKTRGLQVLRLVLPAGPSRLPAARTRRRGLKARLPRRMAAIGALCLLADAAIAAATVYRWVDDNGRVNYSETVPERYRSVARPVTVPAAAPAAEAARDGAGAAAVGKPASAAATVVRRPPSPAPPQPVGKRPARVPDKDTDCETWQRLYFESIDCFGPYRTVRGGIKPEAFERCNEVPEPPVDRCRLRVP
jgi:Domain of unknown function (DUF4124)